MRSPDRAREIVIDSISTIMRQSSTESLEIILDGTDDLDSPRIRIDQYKKGRFLTGIEIPLRMWKSVSDGILRAEVALELVNYFFFDLTDLEKAMISEMAEVRRKFADQPLILSEQIGRIRFKYEVGLRIIDVQLARKLAGDYEVFGWLTKINYDPQWLIQFFEMLIEEAPNRIKPAARMIPRVAGLRTRIRQIQLLIDGQTEKATALRSECEQKASEILEAYTPSTV
ncbi:hypothetical protein IID19_02800 [Patescibacteria group bacterium]|nr:hypothetical protein [Patescibacteria group bacterium]